MKRSHIRPWPRDDARKNREEAQRTRRRDRLDAMMVIATILSSIATTAAVIVGFYQYTVARDQLVAADRNRSIQAMAEQVRSVCQMLEETKIERSIVQRPTLKEPSGEFEQDDLVRWAREMVDDVMSADDEDRVYFGAEAVKNRNVSPEFRTAYATRFKDLRSSAQTARLWIDDAFVADLDSLDANGFALLNPRLVLPITSIVKDDLLEKFFPEQEAKFNNFQMAWSLCPRFETVIVDLAKGKGLNFPEFDVRPILTKENAEAIVREEGRLPRPIHAIR